MSLHVFPVRSALPFCRLFSGLKIVFSFSIVYLWGIKYTFLQECSAKCKTLRLNAETFEKRMSKLFTVVVPSNPCAKLLLRRRQRRRRFMFRTQKSFNNCYLSVLSRRRCISMLKSESEVCRCSRKRSQRLEIVMQSTIRSMLTQQERKSPKEHFTWIRNWLCSYHRLRTNKAASLSSSCNPQQVNNLLSCRFSKFSK